MDSGCGVLPDWGDKESAYRGNQGWFENDSRTHSKPTLSNNLFATSISPSDCRESKVGKGDKGSSWEHNVFPTQPAYLSTDVGVLQ